LRQELASMRWDDDEDKGFHKRYASKKHAKFYDEEEDLNLIK